MPILSDSEVITMLIVGEFLGYDTDKAIWSYFRKHHRRLFPRLGHRTTFVRQAANLWWFTGALQRVLAKHLGALDDLVHVVDGFPILVAHLARGRWSSRRTRTSRRRRRGRSPPPGSYVADGGEACSSLKPATPFQW